MKDRYQMIQTDRRLRHFLQPCLAGPLQYLCRRRARTRRRIQNTAPFGSRSLLYRVCRHFCSAKCRRFPTSAKYRHSCTNTGPERADEKAEHGTLGTVSYRTTAEATRASKLVVIWVAGVIAVALSATSRPGTTPFAERSIFEPTNLAAVPLICCEWYQRPELAGHLTWTDYRPQIDRAGAHGGGPSVN